MAAIDNTFSATDLDYEVIIGTDGLVDIRWWSGTKNQKLAVQFKRLVDAPSNQDVYHMYNPRILDANNVSLALIGPIAMEWEGVLFETNDTDYVCGYHGQEVQTAAVLLVNNVQRSLSPASTVTYHAQRIKLIVLSNVYSRLDTNIMAARTKVIEFLPDKRFTISNKFVFNKTISIHYAYFCMCSLSRTVGGMLISQMGMMDDVYTPDDISTESGGAVVGATYYTGVNNAWMWGDDFSAHAAYTPLVAVPSAKARIQVYSNAVNQNKIYFMHCQDVTVNNTDILGGCAEYTLLLP